MHFGERPPPILILRWDTGVRRWPIIIRSGRKKILMRPAPPFKKFPAMASDTVREQRYLQAVRTLFGEGDKLARDQAYAAEMEQLAGEYPEDLEATCFYALSLLGLATNFDAKPDIQEKYRVQAGALTLGVYGVNPDHPCAAHYTIHAFDDPIHAILALPQARRYAKIAPKPIMRNICPPIFLSNSACGRKRRPPTKPDGKVHRPGSMTSSYRYRCRITIASIGCSMPISSKAVTTPQQP